MNTYLGIVVAQSLQDQSLLTEFRIVATRKGQSWTIHLVSVSEEQLDAQLQLLHANLMTDGHWYAHFFMQDQLAVVFRDAVFHVRTDPATWGPVIEHGLDLGIPGEQLDFSPRTVEDAHRLFALPEK